MTLSVELLSETAASSAIRIDDTLYVNVWITAPTLQQLQAVVAGERQMRPGYRSLEVVERIDKLVFDKGIRECFVKYAEEFVGRSTRNIVVMRAGGFAGAVVHGLVGMFNVVGLATPMANSVEDGLALLLTGAEQSPAVVLPIVQAHIARHVAQHPPPAR